MCRGYGIDDVAARIDRHQAERLLMVRPSDAMANQQLGKGRVLREAASACGAVPAAVSIAVEPPGLAD